MSFALAVLALPQALAFAGDAAGEVDDTGGYVPTLRESAEEAAAQAAAALGDAMDSFSPASTGERFTAPIPHQPEEGEADTVNCGFMITSSRTVAVAGQGVSGGYTAVSLDTEGGITIPETVTYRDTTYTVTSVAAYSFGGTTSVCCSKLTHVDLPDTVTAIEKYAFAYCSSLDGMTVPAATTVIAERAFCKCTGLASLDLSRATQLKTIGTYAFYYDEGIARLTFPASLESIASYGFCQCNGLETIVYEGDCPTLGLYCFTGSTTISQIVFRAGSDKHSDNRYNSEKVDSPECFYTMRFFASKAAAEAGTDPLGTATVSQKTRYLRICDTLEGRFIYDGSIPAFPSGMNVWRFLETTDLSASVGKSCSAYPEASTMFDLTQGGEVILKDIEYRGEAFTGYATDEKVTDNEANLLERTIDYTWSYERQDAEGAWAATDDLIGTGAVRVAVTGTGRYSGTVYGQAKVYLDSGCVFITQVPTAPDSTTTVRCAFQVNGFDEEGKTGTVTVANKRANNAESVAKEPLFALPQGYGGGVSIPSEITVEGCTFAVTGLGSNSFGNEKYHCNLTEVYLPASIDSLGTKAFANCKNLRKVVFDNNLAACSYSQPFAGCSGVKTVVFYDKKPLDSKISLAKFFPDADIEGIDFYYTIRFYESKEAVEKGADAIGRITLSDDLQLMFLPDKPEGAPYVYEGAVPDYPSSRIDDTDNPDRSYFAPTWVYPEVNVDSRVALQSCLGDSVYAYAEQFQQAFAIDEVFVQGVKAQYDYSGADAFAKESVTVAAARGGTLTYGKDYSITWQIYDDWEETWSDAADTIAPAHYRAHITGLGKYASETKSCDVEFDVVARELTVGESFNAPVVYTAPSGLASTVNMKFTVTSVGEGRSVALDATSDLAKEAYAGTFKIPETAFWMGHTYAVTSVADNAFKGNAFVRDVELPEGIVTVGAASFSGCTALTSLKLPSTVQTIGDNAFAQCSALSAISLPSALTSIGAGAFSSTALVEMSIPEGVTYLGAAAFSYIEGFKRLTLPATLSSYEKALDRLAVEELVFASGTVAIPDSACAGCSGVAAVVLPDGLERIGSYAFQQCGLTGLTIPASCTSIGSGAFSSCMKLVSVIFEGNPNDIENDNSFANLYSLKAVVYRAESLAEPDVFFTGLGDDVRYYSTVHYCKTAEDGSTVEVGCATARHGALVTTLMSQEAASAAGVLFDGAVPALPEGCNAWRFRDTSLSATVEGTLYADAYAADLTDLSFGAVITDRVYKYTGSTVNPINDGTGYVILADGTVLRRGFDYEPSFSRLNAQGEWEETRNFASVGQVRITATAVDGSGYTGSAVGYYCITKVLEGDTFIAKNADGLSITYRILRCPTYDLSGLVQVGNGSTPAIDTGYTGAVNIPETVADAWSASYRVASIGASAFYRCMGVSSVDIPATVESIGSSAFAYESARTDVKTSNLGLVHYRGSAADIAFGKNVYRNCDVVSTVIYGGKKGGYEQAEPFQVKARIELVHYYTVRYYKTAEDQAAGTACATCILKEGTYAESPSKNDYYTGSDLMPDAPEGCAWIYDASAMDNEGRITDAMDVVAAEVPDTGLSAQVEVTNGSGTTKVMCSFTALSEPAEGAPGTAAVGSCEDGKPAVAAATAGAVTIPESITVSGRTYTVTQVGSCAFGASEEEKACRAITAVTLPKTITAIGKGAFANCTALAHVDGLKDCPLSVVGSAAFLECSALSTIELPSCVREIEDSAFRSCGLSKVTLPSGLERLGKRAFDGCADLREVVFAGAFELELPAIDAAGTPEAADATETLETASAASAGAGATAREDGAASGLPAAETGTDACTTKLALVEDYSFSNCPKLSRIAFELNAAGLVFTASSLENSTALSQVIYAGSAADLSACEASLAQPVRYYTTIQYYAKQELAGTAERIGYATVPAGTVPAQLRDEDLYAGAVPPLEMYFEWGWDVDASAPLTDSCNAWKQKTQMALDASAVDAAFDIAFTVNGKSVQTAGYGDTVSVAVTNRSYLSYWGLTLTDEQGNIVLETDAEQASFVMPGSPVHASVACDLVLSVSAVKATGEQIAPVTLSLSDMQALAGESAAYSGWYGGWDPEILETEASIGLEELARACGMRFDSGDFVSLTNSAKGRSVNLSYDDLYLAGRSYYPGIGQGSAEGGVEIGPALCVSSTEYSATDGSSAPDDPSMQTCYRFAFGQTAKELAKKRDTVSKWIAGVDSIEFIYGAESIGACTVTGIESGYAYTGEAIEPVPVVTDRDGTVLTAGKDYLVTYENNIDAGSASVTVSGTGVYTGEQTIEFGIRRARELAGENSPATAAAIALEAYPDGSQGVIVSTNKSFPDALCASALSGALSYPILLVGAEGVPDATRQALEALSAGMTGFEVIVLGGENAVSADAYAILGTFAENENYCLRLFGQDRYATCAAVFDYGRNMGLWTTTAVVATGQNFPDALSIAPYAACTGAPILLARDGALDDGTIALFESGTVTSAIIVGGTAAVAADTETRLVGILGAEHVTRLAGANRYETCTTIATWETETQGMGYDGVALATGERFPDALAGAALLGLRRAPLLLVSDSDTSTLGLLSIHKDEVVRFYVLGGTSAVSEDIRTAALACLGWEGQVL